MFGVISMIDPFQSRLALRLRTAILLIASVCGVFPGLVWVASRIGWLPLGIYSRITIHVAPMLALPALLVYVIYSSLESGAILTKSSSIERENRPVAFALSIAAMSIFAVYLLSLAGL